MKKIWRPVGLAAILPLLSAPSWGLGLGDINMRSYLNEPLRAEIALLDVAGLNAEDIRIRLATQGDFDRLGVDRAYFLTSMQFSVEIDGRDRGRIVLTTEEPLLEPYLDFIIETRWPSGRLLREYTVLVDLPSEASAPIVASSRDTGSAPSTNTGAPTAPPQVAAPVKKSRPAVTDRAYTRGAAERPAPGGQYLVQQADTLWAIAASARPSDATVEQTMLAVVGLNPKAFAGGNINGLKAGYVLDLPAEGEISISQGEALDAVAQQNSDWARGIRTAPALRVVADTEFEDALDTDRPMGDEPAMAGGGGSVADMDAKAGGAASGEAAGVAEVSAQDFAAVQSQLSQLSAQLEGLRELVTLKDEQIAQLQARLAEAETVATVPAEPVVSAAVSNEPVTTVAPAPVTSPAPQPASGVLGLPWWQVGVGGVLLAALLGWLVARRGRDDSAKAQTLAQAAGIAVPIVPSKVEAVTAPVEAGPEEMTSAEPAPEPSPSDIDAEDGERGYGKRLYNEYAAENPLSDAIAEADIYIAYGRYQQALDLLKTALANDPGNASGYLKMLDIYIKTDRGDEARDLLGPIRETGDAEAIAQAESRVAELEARAESAAGMDLGELGDMVQPKAHAAPVPGGDEAPATEALDTLSFDLEPTVTVAPEVASEAVSATEEADTLAPAELELDLDMDAETEPAEGADWGDDTAERADDGKLPPELAEVLGSDTAPDIVDSVEEDDEEEGGLIYATEADPMDTKLDLARAYIDMGDEDGARPVLEEVIEGGDLQQQAEARELLLRIE